MRRLAHEAHGPPGGPLVLLLHSLAMDRTMWAELLPHLDAGARVVACDLAGHGRSPRVTDLTVEGMADDVAGLLQELAPGPAVVVGLSLGACVAQVLAVRHRDLVAAVGLLNTTCWYGADAAQRWRERAQLARERGLDSLADVQRARWFTPEFDARRPEVADRLLEVLAANDIDCYEATCRALGAFDFRDEVRRVDVPAAVLTGEQDTTTPPAYARDLHGRIAGSTITILPECAHMSAVQRPAEVAGLVDDLLRRAGGGARGRQGGEGVAQGPA